MKKIWLVPAVLFILSATSLLAVILLHSYHNKKLDRVVRQMSADLDALHDKHDVAAAQWREYANAWEQARKELDILKEEKRTADASMMQRSVELDLTLTRMNQLIGKMPQIEKRLAYVSGYSSVKGVLTANYAEWLTGDSALKAARAAGVVSEDVNGLPNGFYIHKIGESSIRKVDSEPLVYVIEGSSPVYLEHRQLEAYIASNPNGLNLFWLYEVNGKIVFLQEQYVP